MICTELHTERVEGEMDGWQERVPGHQQDGGKEEDQARDALDLSSNKNTQNKARS